MNQPYQHIEVDRQKNFFQVRLRNRQLDEAGLEGLGAELHRLIDVEDCRNMILHLGPEEPLCLYSVFLAKLIKLLRRLQERGGKLALAQASPATQDIFKAAGLDKFFQFYPDSASAEAALQ